ncbi:hypothetical protein [Anabaena azotica]|uniref:Uncharacterized protein n=1 Tax=Anabaena azotica FACHB-119 TaxID=947527 RepID=A0ABR8DCP5_9NOST|nr:hypothetical protein [Anabaena azotica]MBD2503916.1 hypothetical protein [Anabaena azotica FACHB-119]
MNKVITTELPTREELIALCQRAIVKESNWRNRDSFLSQENIGRCWALLQADCQYEIVENSRTWDLEFEVRGFQYFEIGEIEIVSGYIPKQELLDAKSGNDWY